MESIEKNKKKKVISTELVDSDGEDIFGNHGQLEQTLVKKG